MIVEHIRQMGGEVTTSLSSMDRASVVEPFGKNNFEIDEVLNYLQTAHQIIINIMDSTIKMAESEGDVATSDMLVKFLQDHQMMEWFIRSSMK